jgi:hypothetical protein
MKWSSNNNNTNNNSNIVLIPFPTICEERRNEMNVYSRCSKNRCFVLHGTIPYYYKDDIYHQLIDIYLPHPNFPNVPPVLYVRKADRNNNTNNNNNNEEPFIEKFATNHPSVDPNTGQIYCPYLTRWDSNTSTLRILLQTISRSFQNQPPVVRSRRSDGVGTTSVNNNNYNNDGSLTGRDIILPSSVSVGTTEETVSSTTVLTFQQNDETLCFDDDFEDIDGNDYHTRNNNEGSSSIGNDITKQQYQQQQSSELPPI